MNANGVVFRCIETAWCACLVALAAVGAIAFLAAVEQTSVLQATDRGRAAAQVAGACEEPQSDRSAADVEAADVTALMTAR